MDGSSFPHVITLTSLVTMGIVMVEMFLNFHVALSDHMLKVYVNLRVRAPRGKLPPCHIWWPLA